MADQPHLFQDASNSKDGGRRHFMFITCNGLQQVVSCVIQTFGLITEALSVGSPKDNNLWEAEGTNSYSATKAQ